MSRPGSRILGALLLALLTGCGDAGPPPEPPGSRFPGASVSDDPSGPAWALDAPIYSHAQARAGEEVFRTVCSFCHYLDYFTGSEFRSMWTGASVGELFDFISSAMPQDNPGALEADTYAAVLAFLLELNGLPAGDEALASEASELRQYRLVRPGG